MNDDELREQLALAAVGALTDDERTALEDVLSTRPDLQGELDELEAAATAFADAVAETPPPALRASILDAIAGVTQEPPVAVAPAAAPAAPDAPVPAPVEHASVAPVAPIRTARSRRRWLAVGSIAAAVIAILVGVLVVSPWSSDTSDPIAAVLESEDAIAIPLRGDLAGLAIVHSADRGATVLTGADISLPEGDKVYELWAIRGDSAPEPVDTFRPVADGTVALLLVGVDPASATWAVTEEPAGGSDTPTLPILAVTA